MDTDFQEQYQNAERAYGQADYASAHAIARGLLEQLMVEPDRENEAAILNWRALVFLLLGNIELHGLNQPEQADNSYQQVLQCEPQDILAELAKQGVERCRTQEQTNLRTASQGDAPSTSSINTSPLSASPPSASALPDLLRDPFLTTTQAQRTEPAAPQTTAMPWLEETAISIEPSNPSLDPSTSLVPSTSSPPSTIESEQAPDSDSLFSPSREAAQTETSAPEVNPSPKPVPVPVPVPVPSSTKEPESAEESEEPAEQQPIPRAAALEAEIESDVLEGSSLRVKITPQPEEPISVPAEQTGPRSWLTKLKRLSTRR